MKTLFLLLHSLCAVLAHLTAARTPNSIFKQEKLPGQVEAMSEPGPSKNSGPYGHNNFTYGPVPEEDQLFGVEFLEVAPMPITADRVFFILLRGYLEKPKGTALQTTDNLSNATASLTMTADLDSGKHDGPITYTVPFRTTPLGQPGLITIRNVYEGTEVDYLTYDTLHDVLVYCMIPKMFVRSGTYTFEIVTRLEDETCIFAYTLTQWLEGDLRD
ncbi:hypothetical protein F5Y10DRAFT_220863 [Nemania abortiva]|nr:hypothetical protein F5Y10DRAFT_220863 [Nemania abortiva]